MLDSNATASELQGTPGPGATVSYRPLDSASELVRVLDQYLADLQAGKAPDRERILAEHPDLAVQLEPCFAGIEFVHRAAKPQGELPTQLGDFRIVREVGRGGMGVVYEAEQVSLKRRVALKVLRFGVATDAEVMRRFQREAETVAYLHHTNIVPIHAVGCEHGVHYYAMQFIEGHSLAAVFEERHQAGAPPGMDLEAFREVARWGLQAAEALAHAHQRGVIHRDIKPSNLILDPDGTVWLTDFGLAKRADEVTLTAAGVLLGTPRYMSPEQAAATRQPIDHRTDLYSLGATLYELATGKPVFEAQTPQGVITQILSAEPVAPRRLQGRLPRDLETIILKCLAKEPARRYARARDLANDLRAFLDNRAIKARRAGRLERAVRWAGKRRQSIKATGLTTAASVLLVVLALLGWQWHAESRLGRVTLTTEGPALAAEVLLEDRDDLPVKPFTVPTQEPISLPAGSYRLRLSGPGMPSETAQLLVRKGILQQFSVKLGSGELWDPVPVSQWFDVVDLAGRADLILFDERGLRRLDGATGKVIWERTLGAKDFPPATGEGPAHDWKTWFGISFGDSMSGHDRAQLIRPAPDLDGDGVRDLVWVGMNPASLFAVSGKDGKTLWSFTTQAVRDGEMKQIPADEFDSWVARLGSVTGQPFTADVDGDGIPDFIAAFEVPRTNSGVTLPGGIQVPRQRWVEAVSGRTGKSLWRRPIDDRPGFRGPVWPPGVFDSTNRAAQLARVAGKPVVLAMDGNSLFAFDLKTGQPAWPARELEIPNGQPAARVGPFNPSFQDLRVVDLDGDGQDEALLFGPNYTKEDQTWRLTGHTLAALSLPALTPLWKFEVPWRGQGLGFVVADLDGDGKPEVIVHGATEKNWWGIEVLDGFTGRSRWPEPRAGESWREQRACLGLVVGPDIDGDGHRDLFVASRGSFEGKQRGVSYHGFLLFVDAVSGKDGRVLWSWQRPLQGTDLLGGSLSWWQPGADGWPQLLVPMGSQYGEKLPTSCLREAAAWNTCCRECMNCTWPTSTATASPTCMTFVRLSPTNPAPPAKYTPSAASPRPPGKGWMPGGRPSISTGTASPTCSMPAGRPPRFPGATAGSCGSQAIRASNTPPGRSRADRRSRRGRRRT